MSSSVATTQAVTTTAVDWRRDAPPKALEVLDTWFGTGRRRHLITLRRCYRWFDNLPNFDPELSRRFRALLDSSDDPAAAWGESTAAMLASILLYDQLPRNIY